jgi:senescence-induced receptor-like serine/threonine-protein kinase
MEFSFLPKYNSSRYHVYMYFAEIQKLQENQIREFNIFVNGKLLSSEVNPLYLQNLYYSRAISETKLELWLNKTSRSTLPPLFNAVEIYMSKDFLQSETYQTDGMYYLVRYIDFTLKFLFTVNSRPCTSVFTCIILTILSC